MQKVEDLKSRQDKCHPLYLFLNKSLVISFTLSHHLKNVNILIYV